MVRSGLLPTTAIMTKMVFYSLFLILVLIEFTRTTNAVRVVVLVANVVITVVNVTVVMMKTVVLVVEFLVVSSKVS